MHLDQLPGAHRTPHARSEQGPCQNRKPRAKEHEGARSHFRHWEPGRRPLVPIAWLSPLHSRQTQAHQAEPASELRRCRGDVDSTYPPWSPRSRLRRRGLSAPSSRFFSGRAKKVLQTMSARFSQSNMCTGRMNLVWLTSPIFDEGKLRSTPLLSHSALWPYRYGRLRSPHAHQWIFRHCVGTGD